MKIVFLCIAFVILGALVLPEVSAGFGCPNQYACNNHCRSIDCKAGYCSGFLKLRCTCTRCYRNLDLWSDEDDFQLD